ncbi:hypothetical protein DL89DRAFT_75974 [Linderina pennispora]|uniref:ABC-2 type transporter transmembrane domain-containing protein n=1 Tax=Linderina pennispora TaxID=61395 RepID=A0A1Y1VXN7_9FUNG|nr:uncharacterized protein DL89DRAFT_75974 [Linderina pennispora]ORX66042.1 hypothetical protein DL89DRAFT_75974 [Linderina pennispora]
MAGKDFIYLATCAAISVYGFAFGITIGAAFGSLATILAVLPMVLLSFLLFGRLLVNTGSMTVWLGWVHRVSLIKYGYAVLSRIQYTGYVVDGVSVGDSYPHSTQVGSLLVWTSISFVFVPASVLWCVSYVALWSLTESSQHKHSRRQLKESLLGSFYHRLNVAISLSNADQYLPMISR